MNEDLHVLLDCFTEPTDGYHRLAAALVEVRKYLIPVSRIGILPVVVACNLFLIYILSVVLVCAIDMHLFSILSPQFIRC